VSSHDSLPSSALFMSVIRRMPRRLQGIRTPTGAHAPTGTGMSP
jgi:hypothetical protein